MNPNNTFFSWFDVSLTERKRKFSQFVLDNLIIAFLNKCFRFTSVVFRQVAEIAEIAFFAGLSSPSFDS